MGYDQEIKELIERMHRDLDEKKKEFENEFREIIRIFTRRSEQEIATIKKSAEKSLQKTKSAFVYTASGILAIILLVVSTLVYSGTKDVNGAVISLQKDILSARSTVETERVSLLSKIKDLNQEIETLKKENIEASNSLTAIKAEYENRINEMKAVIDQGRKKK